MIDLLINLGKCIILGIIIMILTRIFGYFFLRPLTKRIDEVSGRLEKIANHLERINMNLLEVEEFEEVKEEDG